MSSDEAPIAVGVDGEAATRSAVQYAALQAAAIGAPLMLVHVVAMPRDEAAYATVDRDALLAHGRKILSESADIARATAPGIRVLTDLHHGTRKSELAFAARGSAKIVIGRSPTDRIGRTCTRSMAITLAEQAPCPVVIVPADWHLRSDDPVLVGYKSPDASLDAPVNQAHTCPRSYL